MDLNRFESNWLSGLTRFERKRDEFEAQFIAPLAQDIMMMMLNVLPPQQLAELIMRDPETVNKIVSGKGGNNGRQIR